MWPRYRHFYLLFVVHAIPNESWAQASTTLPLLWWWMIIIWSARCVELCAITSSSSSSSASASAHPVSCSVLAVGCCLCWLYQFVFSHKTHNCQLRSQFLPWSVISVSRSLRSRRSPHASLLFGTPRRKCQKADSVAPWIAHIVISSYTEKIKI